MALRPEFRRGYRVEVLLPDRVFLHGEQECFLLTGRPYSALAPLLDGRRSLEEIIERLRSSIDPLHVFQAIERLREAGHVFDAGAQPNPSALPFWSDLEGEQVVEYREQISLAIEAVGRVDASPLEQRLEANGVRMSADGTHVLVLSEGYLQPQLNELDERLRRENRPWLLCMSVGEQLRIGPLFDGDGACLLCLQSRQRFHQHGNHAISPVRDSAADLLAATASRWIASNDPSALRNRITTVNPSDMACRDHRLVRRPQCPQCGDPEWMQRQQESPDSLRDAIRLQRASAESTEERYRRLRHHVSDVCGIVRSLRTMPRPPNDPHVPFTAVADHLFIEPCPSGSAGTALPAVGAAGKGDSEIHARLGAICESIERYSGVFQGDEARLCTTADDLGDRAIHPNDCMLYSERQFKERETCLMKVPAGSTGFHRLSTRRSPSNGVRSGLWPAANMPLRAGQLLLFWPLRRKSGRPGQFEWLRRRRQPERRPVSRPDGAD